MKAQKGARHEDGRFFWYIVVREAISLLVHYEYLFYAWLFTKYDILHKAFTLPYPSYVPR